MGRARVRLIFALSFQQYIECEYKNGDYRSLCYTLYRYALLAHRL